MSKTINIILGLKDNPSCRNLVKGLNENLGSYFNGDFRLGDIAYTYSKEELDSAIESGQYQACLVLEKMDVISTDGSKSKEKPIGQGAIKAWRNKNPDLRIVLFMGANRKASPKTKGLYENEYYDGFFAEKGSLFESLAYLFEYGRTKEDAYIYYGLKELEERERLEEQKKEAEAHKEDELSDGENASLDNADVSVEESKGENIEVSITSDARTAKERPLGHTDENKEVVDEDSTYSPETKPNDSASEIERTEVKELTSVAEKEEEEDNLPITVDKSEPTTDESLETTEQFIPKAFDNKTDESSLKDSINSGPEIADTKKREFTDGGTTPVSQKGSKFAIIKQNSGVSRKSLNKILSSEGDAETYFNSVTANAYKETGEEKAGNFDTAEELFIHVLEEFMSQYEVVLDNAADGTMVQEELENMVFDVVEELQSDEGSKRIAYERFLRFVNGYDFLEELIANKTITDVHVLDSDHIRIKQNGERSSTNLHFYGTHRYERLCKQLLLRNRERLNSKGITSSYTDTDFSKDYFLQVTIVDRSINSNGYPELMIRKTPKTKRTLSKLIEEKRVTKIGAAYLVHEVNAKKGMIISGGPSSAKTTLLNALIDYIPKSKSGTIIQYKDELLAGVHPEITVQHPLAPRDVADNGGTTRHLEGVSLGQLAEDSLLKDTDYYILGDIKGKEAESFYRALLDGYIGWACVTALTPKECLNKLVTYIAGLDVDTQKDVRITVADKIGTIVIMDNWNVKEIYQVAGLNKDGEFEFKSIINETER